MTVNPDQFNSQPIYVGRPDRAIEMVPSDVISAIAAGNELSFEHGKGMGSPETLASDIRAQGWQSPAVIMYNHGSRTAYLGEGNHRVAAAVQNGISHVPARVVRLNMEGRGTPVAGFEDGPDSSGYPIHVPGDMRPSQIGIR